MVNATALREGLGEWSPLAWVAEIFVGLMLGLVAYRVYRLEKKRDRAELNIETVALIHPFDKEKRRLVFFYRVVNVGLRDTALRPKLNRVILKIGDEMKEMSFENFYEDHYLATAQELESGYRSIPKEPGRVFAEEDYVIRSGQLKGFYGRLHMDGDKGLAPQNATLRIVPVLGEAIEEEFDIR